MAQSRISRRATLGGMLGAAGLAMPAFAQDWPARPIRMLVPYPPGGASDVIARLLAQPMSEMLGQAVVVENRPGANGGIAAEAVARSAPDGYTLLMGNAGPNALNQALLGSRLPYDCVRDFTPVSLVSKVPMVIAVNPATPARTLPELLDWVRQRPGEVSYAHGGVGSAPHLTMEQIAVMRGVSWTAVPFRGGQLAITAVVAGQIPIIMDTAVVVLPQVRDGRLRGIAVTTLERVPQAPELPTMAEQGFPGFEATSWGGILGPARLPPPVTERLHAAVVRAMGLPEVKDALIRQGVQPRTSTPAEFAAHIASEVRRWTEVVQRAGIKPE